MHKLTRFNSFDGMNEDEKDTDTRPDDWHQHITLPLPPAVMDFYNKYRANGNSADNIPVPAQRENEHIFSAIADLIAALGLDTKEFIDYLLDRKDLMRCQPTDEP